MFKQKVFFLALSLLTICGNLMAQLEEMEIVVRSDEQPSEISWVLLNQNGDTLLTDNGEIIEPKTRYEWFVEVPTEACLYFEIKDSGNDGIGASGGYYILKRPSEPLDIFNSNYQDKFSHNLGDCGFGRTCETAEVITTSFSFFSPPLETYWYQYTPPEDGIFSLTTCNNVIIDSLSGEFSILDTRLWIYDSCPSRLFDGPEGALIYSEDFSSCSPGAGFSFFSMKGGRTYYFRLEYESATWNEQVGLDFYELPELAGCTDPNSCNYNPFATKDDGTCFYSEDCLPDLTIEDSLFRSSLRLDSLIVTDECLIEEQCIQGYGDRDIIRFSTEIRNIGTADFIVGNPETSASGSFSKENCHEHWHQLGYAEYILFRGEGEPEPIGFKTGFCVLDIGCSDETAIPKYSCEYMGITAGCYDVYEAEIDCQWIDVTDIPDGNYTMVARVNWTKSADLRGKRELSYDNNTVQVCFNLDRSSGTLVMTKLEDCTTYSDCFGVENGAAIVDCEGNCGGNAEFGDVNQDTRVNQEDIAFYLDGIKTEDIIPTTCTDLSGDGRITVYDAALLQECSENIGPEHEGHAHCNFPKTIFNEQQKATFQIIEWNQAQGYLDIAYKSPDVGLKGFQFQLDGIAKINRVENLTALDFTVTYTNQAQVFSLLQTGALATTFEYRQLLRVYIESIEGMPPAIQSIEEVINQDYQLIASDIVINETMTAVPTACEQLLVRAQQQSIQIEGVDYINTRIRYFGPATNWEDKVVCDGDCQTTQSIDGLSAGSYTVKVETFAPYCYTTFTVEVTEANVCGQAEIRSTAENIELSNLPSTAKVEWAGPATAWQNQVVCDGNCPENEVISVAQSGNYVVKVQTFNPYCYSEKEVVIIGENDKTSSAEQEAYCTAIEARLHNDTLNITNIIAPNKIIKVYDENWQLIFACSHVTCTENIAIPIDANSANYHIDIQLYDAHWEDLCTKIFTLNSNNELTARNSAQLRLHSFLQSQKVQLEWLSNSSWRTQHFVIERSTDGQTFEQLEQVAIEAQRNSDDLHYYRQEDLAPVFGINYYRIKEVFKDGNFHYSNTQIMTTTYDPSTVSISPNPASDFLLLNLSPFLGKSVNIQLVNHVGKSIKTIDFSTLTKASLTMNIGEIPSGFYFVQIRANGQALIGEKIVVERL